MEKYAGSAVLEVDGIEVEIIDLNVTRQPGRKLVKTMNSDGHARGFSKGIATWEISLTAVLPIDGTEIDWDEMSDAKLTSYLGCFSTPVGEKYSVDNEAVIDVQVTALKKVKE